MNQKNALQSRSLLPRRDEMAANVAFVEVVSILAMIFAHSAGNVPTIWPANGVLLGIMLTSRRTTWPGYLVFGFIANLTGAFLAGYTVELGTRLALVDLVETAVALILMPSLVGGDYDLSYARGLWRFGLFAAVLAPAVGASVNFGMRTWLVGSMPPPVLTASYLAHALGFMTITPFVLAVRCRAFPQTVGLRGGLGTAAALAILLGTTVLVYSQTQYPLLFLMFPPLVLVVVVAGFPGGTLALFLSTLISVGLAAAHKEPTRLIIAAGRQEQMIVVQVFTVVSAVVVLALSAILAERDRAQRQLREARDEMAELAATDGLTGLANRRRLDQVLDEECRRATRDNLPLSLLLLDVDRFKTFNDSYGHPSGDDCLRAIAGVLRQFARRAGNLAARYGGEELVLVLPATTEAAAVTIAESVRAGIAALALPHTGNTAGAGMVTASIGVSTADHGSQSCTPATLLKTADAMLYEAKRTGRNQVMSGSRRPMSPTPPVLPDEAPRAAAAEAYCAAVPPDAAVLDEVAALAASVIGVPIGLMSLVCHDRQVFVGRHGVTLRSTNRESSFCAHAITGDGVMVVPDATADPRFRDNPLVTGDPGIRFYAGMPLVSPRGHRLGTLCVIDKVARAPLTEEQRAKLGGLALLAMMRLEQFAERQTPPAAKPAEAAPMPVSRGVAAGF